MDPRRNALNRRYDEPSIFTPEDLLREARRQRGVVDRPVPTTCVLDPDGDIARYLRVTGASTPDDTWACYHTTLARFDVGGHDAGVVPYAVGSSFAVLVAEQLFASGCHLLISVTSSGRIAAPPGMSGFVLISEALRDEGTSIHYLPADERAALAEHLRDKLDGRAGDATGTSWTTDAPYRETASAVAHFRSLGAYCVEMEAAALYAFARARQRAVVCFAHVTNALGEAGDFEKGEDDGARAALDVIAQTIDALN